jgi:hypothetical protein
MRADPLLVLGLLLLASCGPNQGPSGPEKTVPKQAQSAPNSAVSKRNTNALEHFWFSYPYQPKPGSRVWINVAQTNWIEMYPDGSQSRYRLLGRETIDGLVGVVVSKFSGDLEGTQTLNDGSFEAFLPDRSNARMVLYFRNRINGQWQPWRPLAQVNSIE